MGGKMTREAKQAVAQVEQQQVTTNGTSKTTACGKTGDNDVMASNGVDTKASSSCSKEGCTCDPCKCVDCKCGQPTKAESNGSALPTVEESKSEQANGTIAESQPEQVNEDAKKVNPDCKCNPCRCDPCLCGKSKDDHRESVGLEQEIADALSKKQEEPQVNDPTPDIVVESCAEEASTPAVETQQSEPESAAVETTEQVEPQKEEEAVSDKVNGDLPQQTQVIETHH